MDIIRPKKMSSQHEIDHRMAQRKLDKDYATKKDKENAKQNI